MVADEARIVIAGAGSIGCYAGACLAAAGRQVILLTRPRVEAALRLHGLRSIDLDGRQTHLAPGRFALTSDPAIAFGHADIILIAVKSGGTLEMAGLIAGHAPPQAIVVSLQNGVDNVEVLRRTLPAGTRVLAGMVPFNVVQSEPESIPLTVRRTTEGTVLIDDAEAGLAASLSVPGLAVRAHPQMQAVLWGKLLMNLNNAANALSDLPLAQQLSDRNWRRLLADQISEGLQVMAAHGIAPARIQGVAPRLLPWILRLPDRLFRIIARRMLAIDPRARSSMWEDLSRGRPTEIDYLQGVIVRLAGEKGLAAPLATRIIAAVKKAEGKPVRSHSVEEIRSGP
ncbi:MAG: 2-dehydropantoate 2-reductase [Phyllobacterium sp.]